VERRVWSEYRLDVATAWPRLWLVLPADVRSELRLAAGGWHRACVWATWAVVYAVVAVLWWPVVIPAVVLAGTAWARGRATMEYRAALVEAAFDTYGPRLAQALAVPLGPAGRLTATSGAEVTARIAKGA
jgi:hypothetical protein